MMLCLRKGAKVCGKRTLYFFTDFTRESNVTVVVVSPARSVYVSPLVSFGQLITNGVFFVDIRFHPALKEYCVRLSRYFILYRLKIIRSLMMVLLYFDRISIAGEL